MALETSKSDRALLGRFIAAFGILGDLSANDVPPLLAATVDSPASYAEGKWQPARIDTPTEALSSIRYDGPLPELFESLALSYRWLEVDLGICTLLANPPADDLNHLANAMRSDKYMTHVLAKTGFVRFAKAGNFCYDPICFDLTNTVNGDCPIVRLNHESILSNGEIGDVEIVSLSFREMMVAIINSAT